MLKSVILAYSRQEPCHIGRVRLLLLASISHKRVQASLAFLNGSSLASKWFLGVFEFPFGTELIVFERWELVFVVSKPSFDRDCLFPFLLNLCTPYGVASTVCIAKPLMFSRDIVFGFLDPGICPLQFGRNCSLLNLNLEISGRDQPVQESKRYV